jgi:hypothetical protein
MANREEEGQVTTHPSPEESIALIVVRTARAETAIWTKIREQPRIVPNSRAAYSRAED